MSPVVRSRLRPRWERVAPQNVFYYRLAQSKKAYCMSFAVLFDRPGDTYEFAYCFPYSFSRLQTWLTALDAHMYEHVQRRSLGRSVEGRPLEMLTITHPRNLKYSTRHPDLRVAFVSARVHPGETPASFVCQGLVDYLVSPRCQALRERVMFKVVPMLNPDGVYHGTYRCSLNGYDLNRCWRTPTAWKHPTIAALKAHLAETQAASQNVDFYLDIHGHTVLTNAFLYGNYDGGSGGGGGGRRDDSWIFPRILADITEKYSLAQTLFNNDKQKAGTGRRSLGSLLSPGAQCFTLEISCQGYCRFPETELIPYTEDSLLELGSELGQAFDIFYAQRS